MRREEHLADIACKCLKLECPKPDLAERIKGGVEDTVNLSFAGEFRYLDTKGSNLSQIEKTISLPEEIEAPVEEGQPIGEAVYKLDGQRIGGVSIVAAKTVEKAGYRDYVLKVVYDFLLH